MKIWVPTIHFYQQINILSLSNCSYFHIFPLFWFDQPWEGNGTPLQYSCLESPMDRGAWWAAVHGVRWVGHDWATSLTFHFHALEKEMATHSSVLAWRIPGMGEPGGLPSMGSHRVRHDWSNLAAAAAYNKAHFTWGNKISLHLNFVVVSRLATYIKVVTLSP